VIRAHRKGPPDGARHASFAALPNDLRRVARKLAMLLRLADVLDADHRQAVTGLRATIGVRRIRLVREVDDRRARGALDLAKLEGFEEELGRGLRIVVGRGRRSRRRRNGAVGA
jgi:hypothetical protein